MQGASKHMGVSKHTEGIQTYRVVSKHIGHPKIQGPSHKSGYAISIEYYSNVLKLKAYLCSTKQFRKDGNGSQMSSLFIGNNGHHMPACAKKNFSLVRKVLTIVKANMSLGSLQGAVAVVSTPARQYFSTYTTTKNWYQNLCQYAVLGLSELVTCC